MLFLVAFASVLGASNSFNWQSQTFKAAVYEHNVTLPPVTMSPISRSDALKHMMINLHVYKQRAIEASQQGADIIVFPEDGIYGMNQATRSLIRPFLEYIPDPKKEVWNPCINSEKYPGSDVQHFLSCLAINNSLFVVANYGDKQPCSRTVNDKCPVDGYFQYNTDLVYNPLGVFIAKYHKLNLYFEYQFNYPSPYDVTTFTTPFGKFGVFTCFDIMFKHPSTDIINLKDVGNIAFTTAWMDALPFLAAIQFHSASAAGLGVNFLAANIHLPTKRFQGSGIYTKDGAKQFYYDTNSNNGKLMISELPIVTHMNIGKNNTFKMNVPPNRMQFQAQVFHDMYNMAPLDQQSGRASVCHNGICCEATYRKHPSQIKEFYALGAFDNVHVRHGGYYIQVCTVIRCPGVGFNKDSCSGYTKSANTRFDELKVRGNFSTPYLYPELIMTENGSPQLAKIGSWTMSTSALEITKPLEFPLVQAGILARVYERDTRDWSDLTLPSVVG